MDLDRDSGGVESLSHVMNCASLLSLPSTQSDPTPPSLHQQFIATPLCLDAFCPFFLLLLSRQWSFCLIFFLGFQSLDDGDIRNRTTTIFFCCWPDRYIKGLQFSCVFLSRLRESTEWKDSRVIAARLVCCLFLFGASVWLQPER